MRKLFYPTLIGVIIIISCTDNNNVPTGIIPQKKMELVLWDYLKADAYSNDYEKKDSTQDDSLMNIQLQQTIFRHYKITRQEFYKSYQYYSSHPALMTTLLDSITSSQRKNVKLFESQ